MTVDPSVRAAVLARVDELAPQLVALSHAIAADPELAYEEYRSMARCAEPLQAAGFAVERGAYGVPTAFAARAGSRGSHLVVCSEYDALPVVGHACGHNIIAASGVGTGLALLPVLDEVGLRLTVLGTPAEEVGGGKVDLINGGALGGEYPDECIPAEAYRVAEPLNIDAPCMDIAAPARASARSCTSSTACGPSGCPDYVLVVNPEN